MLLTIEEALLGFHGEMLRLQEEAVACELELLLEECARTVNSQPPKCINTFNIPISGDSKDSHLRTRFPD